MGSSGCGTAFCLWSPVKPRLFIDEQQSDEMIALLFKEMFIRRTYGGLTMFNPIIPQSLRKVKPGETFPQESIRYKTVYFF